MFADDTCLTFLGDNLETLTERVNQRLYEVADWCRFNKLSLNPSKCCYMLITPRIIQSDPLVTLYDQPLSRVKTTKYLGIQVDDNLKFQSQIESLEVKFSRQCGISYRLRDRFHTTSAKCFYYSCVYSVITYCLCVWGGALLTSHRADRLSVLQGKILKNIFRGTRTNDSVFVEHEILKLQDVYKFYVGVYMYKVIVLESCPSLASNLSLRYPDHRYSTRSRNNLIPSFPRIEALRQNYIHQFSKIWNEIPNEIKQSRSLRSFKKSYKNHLLSNY